MCHITVSVPRVCPTVSLISNIDLYFVEAPFVYLDETDISLNIAML